MLAWWVALVARVKAGGRWSIHPRRSGRTLSASTWATCTSRPSEAVALLCLHVCAVCRLPLLSYQSAKKHKGKCTPMSSHINLPSCNVVRFHVSCLQPQQVCLPQPHPVRNNTLQGMQAMQEMGRASECRVKAASALTAMQVKNLTPCPQPHCSHDLPASKSVWTE